MRGTVRKRLRDEFYKQYGRDPKRSEWTPSSDGTTAVRALGKVYIKTKRAGV